MIDELSRENVISGASRLIQIHEGLRLKPYKDTTGHLSIGYGRNLDSNGLRFKEALFLLNNDLEEAYSQLLKYEWFKDLSHNRKITLVDMMFNLGPHRFSTFKKMLKALRKGDFDEVSKEMLASKWASQVGKRSQTLADLMKNG